MKRTRPSPAFRNSVILHLACYIDMLGATKKVVCSVVHNMDVPGGVLRPNGRMEGTSSEILEMAPQGGSCFRGHLFPSQNITVWQAELVRAKQPGGASCERGLGLSG
jgi:hypothetical protein